MALEAAADLVFSFGPISLSSGAFGVVAQADGSYLFGFSEGSDSFPFGSTGHWYRSTDQGATWSLRTDGRGTIGQRQNFPTNIHTGIACAATWDPPTFDAYIQRSINGASSWTDVFHVASAASPNGREPIIKGVQSFDQISAVAWGELDGNNTNPAHLIALSSNAGVTWTPQVSWDQGDKNDVCNALGIAENGRMWAQYTKFGGINRTSNFARSINGGSTWSVLSPPPGGDGTPPNEGYAITAFDENNIVLVGQARDSGGNALSGVWWSDDAGDTLTLISTSAIADFPSGNFNNPTYEIKRLTRDACVIAMGMENAGPDSPWRISLDMGHTFPIRVEQNSPGPALYQIPFGKIVTTRDGHLLMPLWSSPTYDEATIQLWRAKIEC